MTKRSRRKKQAIRDVEIHLRNYHYYKLGIKNLERRLELFLPKITSSYELKEEQKGEFQRYSAIEEAVINSNESKEAKEIRKTIKQYRDIVESIESVYDFLNKTEQHFVKYKYFEGMDNLQIAENLILSHKQLYTMRWKVLNKFLFSMKNIPKLKI